MIYCCGGATTAVLHTIHVIVATEHLEAAAVNDTLAAILIFEDVHIISCFLTLHVYSCAYIANQNEWTESLHNNNIQLCYIPLCLHA